MLPSLTEIILLVVIALCIFGLGRLGDFSERIGELNARRKRGLPGDDAVDITPQGERRRNAAGAPKPGTRPQPVDEAIIDDDTNDRDSHA